MNQQSRRSGKSGSLACLLLLSAGLAALPATALAQPVERLVTIEGLDDDDLRAEMRDLSALADASRKTSSYAAINRTANEDTSRMTEALHSLGYYAATVTPLVERHRDGADITFRIERGPLFTIADYKIVYTDDIAADRPDGFAGIGIETTGNPDGAVLSAIEASFITWLQRNGFPGASVPDYHVEADFGTGTATAIFETTTGPVARFGKPVVTSADRTKPSFIAAYADWEQGALYDRSEIIDYREKLSETGLFSEITVDAAPPDEDGIADILVSVSDRDRHTLGAGVSYATDIGPGISLYWEDRNMRGRGEDLALVLDLSGLEQELSADFSRPLPTFPGGFDASGSIKNEITDAYDAKSAELASALNHTWFDEKLTVSGGLTLTYSEIDDPLFGSETEPGTETFNYVKFPLTVAWDSSDDLLDPGDDRHRRAGGRYPALARVAGADPPATGSCRQHAADRAGG